MNIEVIRYRLPVYWACALINGDYTDLSDEEEREINNGNYIPVYTSLPITITNNHKLYKYYIC